MVPWLWFWSPHFYLPFSGSVAQRIEPETDWFFAGIPPSAGNGEMERKAFEIASYGRQLGWITEVLLGMNTDDPKVQAQGAQSLDCLRRTNKRIAAMKDEDRETLAGVAAKALEQLRSADPAAYERLIDGARASQLRIPSRSSAS